jgi:hypothetical protein
MTGPEHYVAAESLLRTIEDQIAEPDPTAFTVVDLSYMLEKAKVHAQLATAAAMALTVHQVTWVQAMQAFPPRGGDDVPVQG